MSSVGAWHPLLHHHRRLLYQGRLLHFLSFFSSSGFLRAPCILHFVVSRLETTFLFGGDDVSRIIVYGNKNS